MKSNRLTVGILAHVDAGKTTLAESILYRTGKIRALGRVDHGNAFLDNYELERSRGITIFSKQAEIPLNEKMVTLLDTPGHVDFSAEMERTLQVLDYAILVISAPDGVQGHVQTLWRLLKKYEIPVFLFINKMDQPDTEKKKVLDELKKRLDERCVDFSKEQDREVFYENIAVCEEELLEQYFEGKLPNNDEIRNLIAQRKVFPCYFGSALKMEGVEEFLEGLDRYTEAIEYPEEFGAKVYKISRDKQGMRLTHMKITGGFLKVKTELKEEEKADQLRIYSGAGYELVQEAKAGCVCAVTGLNTTYSGEGLGIEKASEQPILEPVLTYQIVLPEHADVHTMYLNLKQLEEEEPQLHILWNEASGEIHAQVMGEVQIEILKNQIAERFGEDVEFGTGSIVYKETIEETVEGCGHFEPLRHYAEVRLLLEPKERGSGMEFAADCSEDVLDRNWQRLIVTHLEEKAHRGVLTGSEITDMKITLIMGRAHLKHTEGGDFRQSTYRAVRQGLRKAKSILLEPVYEYQLEVPTEMVGRAMSDLQRMQADFSSPKMDGETAILKGTAPVVTMRDYQTEVIAYTKGHGRLFLQLKGYEPCHNAEQVMEEIGYDPEADLENPTGSVFCAHGAGYNVSWEEVDEKMHTESPLKKKTVQARPVSSMPEFISEEELHEIFERTYGPIKRERNRFNRQSKVEFGSSGYTPRKKVVSQETEYLLVDGYNIIFAWEDLKELSKINIEGARNKLMDILCNYQGYKKCTLILVFDAYKVPGFGGEIMKYHNIHVVFTKEAETADQYIEKAVHEMAQKHKVTVATSDWLEQKIIMGAGANRMSAKGLLEDIVAMQEEIREEHLNKTKKSSQYLFDNLSEDMAELMEDVRHGRREL